MLKILIVDDEIKIREVVKEYSKAFNMEADEASNGKEAIELVKKNDYDCIILDIMMPELDGFSACKIIKSIKDVPIIMLSARNEEDDKLFSFEMGVDDYVTKPFSPKELMARIKAVTDRLGKKTRNTYKHDDLIIDFDGHTLTIEGKLVNITPKEFELLTYLINNEGLALDRNKILNNVWKMDYLGDDRTVDTHIKMLRHNLGKYRDAIKTVRGMGYKFEI